MRNIICIIIVALMSIGLISCDSRVDQKGIETSTPKINSSITQAEPYSFKEFKLGMTLAEFNNLKTHVIFKTDDKFAASRIIYTTIGGAKGEAIFLFDEYGKGLQLTAISITIPKGDFSNAKLALTSKYGSPAYTVNIPKSNAMGATFNCESLVWKNDTSQIIAESIGSKIDEAEIKFNHLKLGQSKRAQEDSAKAKNDI
jgi:hypothetical protein